MELAFIKNHKIKKTPVCMMTYERADYFHKSMQSLLKTDLSGAEIIVFDDNSRTNSKLKILKDYEQKGIKIIFLDKRFQNIRVFLKMIRYAIKNYDTDSIVIVEDDIIYNKYWLKKLLAIKKEIPNLGILTPWDRKGRLKSNEKGWSFRNLHGCRCTIGGVCWLVTKKFALEILKAKRKGSVYDSAYQKLCAYKKFNIAVTVPSYVQHFGTISMIKKGPRHKKSSYSNNFIGEE